MSSNTININRDDLIDANSQLVLQGLPLTQDVADLLYNDQFTVNLTWVDQNLRYKGNYGWFWSNQIDLSGFTPHQPPYLRSEDDIGLVERVSGTVYVKLSSHLRQRMYANSPTNALYAFYITISAGIPEVPGSTVFPQNNLSPDNLEDEFRKRDLQDSYLEGISNEAWLNTQDLRRDIDALDVGKGIPGDKGPQGDKGPPGAKGSPGDKGGPGDKGAQGDKGYTGDRGPSGFSGLDAIADGSLTTAKIKDGAVTQAKLDPSIKLGGGDDSALVHVASTGKTMEGNPTKDDIKFAKVSTFSNAKNNYNFYGPGQADNLAFNGELDYKIIGHLFVLTNNGKAQNTAFVPTASKSNRASQPYNQIELTATDVRQSGLGYPPHIRFSIVADERVDSKTISGVRYRYTRFYTEIKVYGVANLTNTGLRVDLYEVHAGGSGSSTPSTKTTTHGKLIATSEDIVPTDTKPAFTLESGLGTGYDESTKGFLQLPGDPGEGVLGYYAVLEKEGKPVVRVFIPQGVPNSLILPVPDLVISVASFVNIRTEMRVASSGDPAFQLDVVGFTSKFPGAAFSVKLKIYEAK